MKRKILSIVASVIVVLTACICLVGCAKVTPEGLEKFMNDFVASANKAIHVEDNHYSGTGDYSFVQLFNNKIYLLQEEEAKTGKRIRTYYEYEEDKKRIITYVGVKANKSDKEEEKWTVTSEAVTEKVDFKQYFNKMIDPKIGYDAESNTFTIDYKTQFTIEDKWIVGNNDSIADGCAFKIENKVLRINYEYGTKKEFHCARLIMNYGDVLIPDNAIKAAKQIGLK